MTAIATHISNINLRHVLAYMFAVFLAIWCLGKSIPALGIGYFALGVLAIAYFSPLLFLKRSIHLKNHRLRERIL